jgi:ABC-type antimicrobial peptide transport system permease subunit
MAITGTYGVTSYAISQRTREFAIRIALGAPVQSLISLVLRTAAFFAAIGIGVGLIVSSIASHLLVPLLYRIAPIDVSVYLFTAALCLAVIIASCLVPVWRVLTMNTTAALRAE